MCNWSTFSFSNCKSHQITRNVMELGKRSFTGELLSPDFHSVSDLAPTERNLIAAYIRLSRAGTPVSPGRLCDENDYDSIWAGGPVFEYKLNRMKRLHDEATDADVKHCLAVKVQFMKATHDGTIQVPDPVAQQYEQLARERAMCWSLMPPSSSEEEGEDYGSSDDVEGSWMPGSHAVHHVDSIPAEPEVQPPSPMHAEVCVRVVPNIAPDVGRHSQDSAQDPISAADPDLGACSHGRTPSPACDPKLGRDASDAVKHSEPQREVVSRAPGSDVAVPDTPESAPDEEDSGVFDLRGTSDEEVCFLQVDSVRCASGIVRRLHAKTRMLHMTFGFHAGGSRTSPARQADVFIRGFLQTGSSGGGGKAKHRHHYEVGLALFRARQDDVVRIGGSPPGHCGRAQAANMQRRRAVSTV